ncbi:ARM repeat-containing protein [Nadsonia fulvescens var. elongata DSM 6958]|uniref:ARM repeat-containing protein n=1 Tax=Nadsonia fulvescens var. elongata DSM 6958 TaxID=857566 RepID=A0A1E3PPT0_9ASCO|nr:ARM repeat-containing protein [Nadsonia fulvescens var. elongata DSM 6958]
MSDDLAEIKRAQLQRKALNSNEPVDSFYDETPPRQLDKYDTSIAVNGIDFDDSMETELGKRTLVGQYSAPKELVAEMAGTGDQDDGLVERQHAKSVYSKESDYQRRKYNRALSPDRVGADGETRSYKQIMEERELEREEQRIQQLIKKQNEESTSSREQYIKQEETISEEPKRARKRRWDVEGTDEASGTEPVVKSEVEPVAQPQIIKRRSRWDQTAPAIISELQNEVEVVKPARRSRWDQSSKATESTELSKPVFGAMIENPNYLSDEMLNQILPTEGYEILQPPLDYVPITQPAQKLIQAPVSSNDGFVMLEETSAESLGVKHLPTNIPGVGELQFFREEDMKYFGKLMEKTKESELTIAELKARKVMRLVLKVKNGAPPVRKGALRQLTDNARSFGPKAIFDQVLPLMLEKSLQEQERHLLVKIINRVLYRLDDLVRPYTHKILVVILPLLIEEDPYARIEGREAVSNLAKAVGLPHMITVMRPDIDQTDEYVRNITARGFAVVASALGVPALIPFIKAVCKSKKSWEARHTGVKIVQQIAVLMGCAILPHLKGLVDCIAACLTDEQLKVRTITALSISALAEASAPYGIESFENVLEPLWMGIRKHRGKGLAAFIKCIGFLIPLMDPEYANYYTKEVMVILLREFNSPDEDMRKIVLKVVQQCAATEGVTPKYLKEQVVPEFFKCFWIRRIALGRFNSLVIDTTLEISQKVGVSEVLERIVLVLKDEAEPFRKMGVITVEKVISSLGAADLSPDLERRLVDGMLTSFQQSSDDNIMVNAFGTVINALGYRSKKYLTEIVSAILFSLQNQSPLVRQKAADLIAAIAIVIKNCDEDNFLLKLGSVLYEQLGEEYPEVLGSILGALKNIVAVVGLSQMRPPIGDLLPRLTPILRNRHEKVQENAIDLVGRIADRGPEYVSPREWMRICFELLDILKAHKKGIRRAANNTFGYIAKAIGPQDVLATLLSNLRVQERQSRVCTAVAIGIVAETCSPFTVLPALMNEYRVPELNVQNGVLKAMSFLFEYIGDMAKDYVYAVTPLLEDALIDRDHVHRQTAASVIKHIALGVTGHGCEDAMIHFLNLLLPNIFETSPHVIDRIIEGIDGVRNCVGASVVLNYIWTGLFHSARKVRKPYWRLYNSAYIQSADAMVPYYPELEEDNYKRAELDIWI